jgi:hypothetical protein
LFRAVSRITPQEEYLKLKVEKLRSTVNKVHAERFVYYRNSKRKKGKRKEIKRKEIKLKIDSTIVVLLLLLPYGVSTARATEGPYSEIYFIMTEGNLK